MLAELLSFRHGAVFYRQSFQRDGLLRYDFICLLMQYLLQDTVNDTM